ncbi:MAG: redox-sensing transcriptional repressor Rex [Gemmatimonadota bacterium]|nr:redox-sensing transcriptional repressor Rex [Gemmatimonadota bacterium]
MTARRASESTVRRLCGYLRRLREPPAAGRAYVSSSELGAACGVTAAQVRKDLSLFGSFGRRGSGYPVEELRAGLEAILGLDRGWRVAVVGAGKIGGALLGYDDLERRGFHLVAAFDADPAKIGTVRHGVRVHGMADLETVLASADVELVILAVPPPAAAAVASRLAACGIRGILNFAPVRLDPGPGPDIRNVDVALELEGLTYAVAARSRRDGGRG